MLVMKSILTGSRSRHRSRRTHNVGRLRCPHIHRVEPHGRTQRWRQRREAVDRLNTFITYFVYFGRRRFEESA
jgi:hypothetical protein